MTDEQLQAIESRWEKAPKEPWCEQYCYTAIRHVDRNCDLDWDCEGHTADECPGGFARYDGPMIANAPSDIAALLAEVRRLRSS